MWGMSLFPQDTPGWKPPHCPNPNCPYHKGSHRRWPYKKNGFFLRQQHPFRIQRFTCQHCHRHFSSQTFSTTYWQKVPLLELNLFHKTVGCMANRQIARDLAVAPATIDRHLGRLGRHCLLFQARYGLTAATTGPLVVDGFESFEGSQYYPFHHNLAVEAETGFFIYFTDSELRRKGRMTPYQKRRRQQLEHQHGRPDPRSIQTAMHELLAVSLGSRQSAVILSDEHPAYRLAVAQLQRPQLCHQVTNSRVRRTARNPLFEVNLLDLLIRHSSAHHKRETIAFCRRRQSSSLRLAIFLVWRNWVKWRWEKRCRWTPAMGKGLMDRRLEVKELLGERLFRTRTELPARWAAYYDGAVCTRALTVNRRHQLKYAY
jgi:transposase-like protein